jgi:hypothetical protein
VTAEEETKPRTITEQVKEYLAEERYRIKLHDLTAAEVRSVLAATAEDYFPPSRPWSPEEFQKRLGSYESALSDLLRVQALIGYWAEPYQQFALKLATTRLAERLNVSAGLVVWINLRWYPVLLLLYSGGIAAVASGKYDNLRELMTNPVYDATHNEDASLIRVVVKEMNRLTEIFKLLPGHENQYTPRSEYLLKFLQPLLEEELFLGTRYETSFDRFEALYALEHAYEQKREGKPAWGPVGRFGWKHGQIPALIEEAIKAGSAWGPIRAGLFDGSAEQFKEVALEYSHSLEKLNWY